MITVAIYVLVRVAGSGLELRDQLIESQQVEDWLIMDYVVPLAEDEIADSGTVARITAWVCRRSRIEIHQVGSPG